VITYRVTPNSDGSSVFAGKGYSGRGGGGPTIARMIPDYETLEDLRESLWLEISGIQDEVRLRAQSPLSQRQEHPSVK